MSTSTIHSADTARRRLRSRLPMPIALQPATWPSCRHCEKVRLHDLVVEDSRVQEIHKIDEHESARIELGRHAEVRLLCSVLCVGLLCAQHTQRTAGQHFSVHPNGCRCCTMRGRGRSRDGCRFATRARVRQGPTGHANVPLER